MSVPKSPVGRSDGDNSKLDDAPPGAPTPAAAPPASSATGPVSASVHSGLKWVTLSLAWIRGMQFLVTMILARLLDREAFGLVALAMSVTMVLAAIREVGLGHALIQRPDQGEADTRRAANTMFFLSSAVNLALFITVMIGAPYLASLLPKMGDETVPVLRVMLIPMTFAAFGSTAAFLLQRRLAFGGQSLADGGAAATNAAVAIGCAVAGFGVWSIVFGLLAGRLVNTVMLLRFARWFPSFQYCRKTARELFSFGKYMWFFGLVDATGRHLDKFVLARVLGAGTLGMYNVAYNFCRMPANQVGSLVNRIAYPALARKQTDLPAMRSGFTKALSHVTVLALPFAFGVNAVAYEFVPVAYGAKWVDAAPIMQVFAFYGALLAVSSVAGPALKAVGKPQVLFYTGLMHLMILVPSLWVGSRWEENAAVGVALGALVPRILSSVVAFGLIMRYLHIRVDVLLAPVIRSTCAAALMFVAVWAFRNQVAIPGNYSEILTLFLSVGIGVIAYVAATALCNRALLDEFLGTLRRVVASRG